MQQAVLIRRSVVLRQLPTAAPPVCLLSKQSRWSLLVLGHTLSLGLELQPNLCGVQWQGRGLQEKAIS